MFSCKEEYESSLKTISHELYEIYGRASVMKMDIRDLLTDYRIFKVDERFYQSDSGGEIVNDTKVCVSLAEALAGNTGNMGKTYGDLINMQQKEERTRYAIELLTTTGVKIGLIIFKGEELALEFDDDKQLQVYGILVDMKKNPQFVDKGGFHGRTLNLYADVTTYVLGPANGNIHGIANYTKVLELANDEEEEDPFVEKEEETNKDKNKQQEVDHDEIFVLFDPENSDRYIPRQEGNIIDFDYYYGIMKRGRDFTSLVLQDIVEKNISFISKGAENNDESKKLAQLQSEYRQPVVNYKYQNREKCAVTSFYADKMNVEVLRLDITGRRSTEAFGGMAGFTSSADYGTVNKVFTVIPDEAFSYDIEVNAADFLAGIGYNDSQRMVFIQAKTNEELAKRAKYMKASYTVTQLAPDLYEYVDEGAGWTFKAYLCGPDFKFVDEVEKLK